MLFITFLPNASCIKKKKKKKKRQTALAGKRRGLHLDTLPLLQASTVTYKEVSSEPLGKEGQWELLDGSSIVGYFLSVYTLILYHKENLQHSNSENLPVMKKDKGLAIASIWIFID